MKKLFPFFKYLKGARKHFIIAFICGLIYGVLSGFGIPVIFEKVFRKIFESKESYTAAQVIFVGCFLPLVFLVRGVFSFLNSYFMTYSGMEMMRALREDIFRRIQQLPMSFFDRNSQGDLIARVAGDPAAVQSATLELASEILKQPAQMIAAVITLVAICIKYESYMLIPLFGVAVAISAIPIRTIKKKLKNKGLLVQNLAGLLTKEIAENLGAIFEVRSFNLENQQLDRHLDTLQTANKMGLRVAKYRKLQQPAMEFISAVVISAVFVYAHFTGMPFSAFSALGFALYFATDPLKRIGNLLSNLHVVEGSIIRINYILDMPISIQSPENPVPLGRARGDITFKDVHFSYEKTPTLGGVNALIPSGKKIALVGHSGAGKSTFAKLVSRFYDVTAGEILLDGICIKEYSLEDLRRNIAIVPQYPVLFNDTIYNNIALGDQNATEEAVRRAAESAFASGFIEKFDNGYETVVGDRGDLLSGGQKQRIAIARAFLKNAPILILDEATSSLDSESEYLIQKAIARLTEGKTVISIAHRLSTIKNADIIFVFQEGLIIAQGNHAELLKSNPIYQNFVNKQNLNIDTEASLASLAS